MQWLISEILRCCLNTDKAGGSAMEVDPVHFPELAIGGKRGKYAVNICNIVYNVMAIICCMHYRE